MLRERTDADHLLTVRDIIDELANYGICAERKSIYSDIDELREAGLDIESVKGRSSGYYLASREFEMPELKLLVDSVQASRFISQKKSLALIEKLSALCSKFEAQQLRRHVYIAGRVKSDNESIYYNIDRIHSAIAVDRRIEFDYFEYSPQKQRILRHNGARYDISPIALIWDDEYYYMVGFDAAADCLKHYRVDKMTKIEITDRPRMGKDRFDEQNSAQYTNLLFGMFSGEVKNVRIRFRGNLAGVVLDRFGLDTQLVPEPNGDFIANVKVAVSPQFFGWLFGLGDGAKILSPDDVVEAFAAELSAVTKQYR